MIIIKVDVFELLELFETEPIIVHDDEQAGVFMYSATDVRNTQLVFLYDVYDSYCEFILSIDDGRHTLCEYRFNNVKSLEKQGDKLLIVLLDDVVITSIIFKPCISIEKIIV